MSRIWQAVFASMIAVGTSSSGVRATTVYHVRLNTSEFAGTARRLTLDWVALSPPRNHARVANLATDARRGKVIFQGGPISGRLVDAAGPPTTMIADAFFNNQLVIPFDSVGVTVTLDVGTTENVVLGDMTPNEFSMFFLNPDDTFAIPTVDPLGANALFAIDATGLSGGVLSVFSPMQFVAPDSLIMSNSTVGVAAANKPGGRLRFQSVVPNPSPGSVELLYELPQPGGLLRVNVFDVVGRLVAVPFTGALPGGISRTNWNGVDSQGRLVPAGVYIVQIQPGGQSLVRRVVLTR